MSEMSELIERMEKAAGPDREADLAIATHLGWTFKKMKGDAKPYWRPPGETSYYVRRTVPYFTDSLDAALTLVPEGMGWTLICYDKDNRDDDRGESVCSIGSREANAHGKAFTPAIALCIAALKAREALSQPPHHLSGGAG